MKKQRILLDTIFLLPILGIEITLEKFSEIFPRILENFEVWYNPISLIEAKWILLRLKRKGIEISMKDYIDGLRAIIYDERLHQTQVTDPKIEEIADSLISKISDYFDRIIYSTAKSLNMLLLTENETLLKLEGTVSWEKIIEKLK